MTVHLCTFSDDSMSRAAGLCLASARKHGVDGEMFWKGPSDVRRLDCYSSHKTLFDAPRGCGYWAFKPALINALLRQDSPLWNINNGDILIYADAGVEFIAPVSHIIERMDQDVWLFGNNWEHAHWCKADVVHEIWPSGLRDRNNPGWLCFGKQCQASVIFFRVSGYSRTFVAEWLKRCLFEGGRLIDDSPSRAPNHPEFREHRHDQAILTTLAYREGIKLHYWPASYNDGAFTYEKLPVYAADDYPTLFNHHRKRNHEWASVA